MKYDNRLTAKLLEVLENSGYYSAKAKAESDDDSQRKISYYKGQADLIVESNGYLLTSEETRKAIQIGKDRYFNE